MKEFKKEGARNDHLVNERTAFDLVVEKFSGS
jgi:hypothetical protein